MSLNLTKTFLPIAILACGQAEAVAQRKQQKPNIIYIMCDDMGYGDLGCYGQQYILTPNIDRMAKEGMRFTQAYAGAPVSAPSRACFMTGHILDIRRCVEIKSIGLRANLSTMEKTAISALLGNILTTQNMLSYQR